MLAVLALATALIFPPNTEHVRLPAHFLNGRVVLRVDAGTRHFDVQLDTGTTAMLLDRKLADDLGLGGERQVARTYEGLVDIRSANVETLRIGPVIMHDVETMVAPYHRELGSNTATIGIIGTALLNECVLEIDYVHETVTAYARENYHAPADAAPLALSMEERAPIVELSIAGVAGRFALDTGADVTIVFPGFAKRLPRGRVQPTARLLEGVRGQMRTRTEEFDDVRLGTTTTDRVDVILLDQLGVDSQRGIDGLLGSSILQQHTLILDEGGSRAWLR